MVIWNTRAARIVAPALVSALGLGIAAVAAENSSLKTPTPTPTLSGSAINAPEGDGGKMAREAFKALNDLNVSARKQSAADAASDARAPERPKKTITAPTMTSTDLDALVDSFLEKAKVPPASLTTDVEFVRRIYLDLTGKIPTFEQTRAFVNTHEKDKRAKLIDQLLGGKEYAANWGRYWRDVIKYHATNEQVARYGYNELEKWLTEQIATNQPWDKVAHGLITATGRFDENGATLFAFSHETQPVEVAGEVSRIFLGVQIQCAQCHDHPNDSWKRTQFHEFASFFAGTRSRRVNPKENPPVFEVFSPPGKPRYTMPDLKNPQNSIPIAPKFFLASTASPIPAGLSAADRHELAASYITGQDNPWFARAFVNRIWYALTGDAFYMPVDDMGPERTAKAPEILNALADQWQRGGYDVRWLFHTILNSKAYQREVRSTFSASGRTPFAANCPSRLRADQIFDSLMQVLNIPANGQVGGPGMGKAAAKKNNLAADLKSAVAKKGARAAGAGPRNGFNALFGIDPSISSDDILGTIPQSLFLMNAPQLNRAMQARPGTILGDILMSTPDNRVALNVLYLRTFAREPTAKEVQTCSRYLATVGNRQEAFEDILWSLINSTEFITRR